MLTLRTPNPVCLTAMLVVASMIASIVLVASVVSAGKTDTPSADHWAFRAPADHVPPVLERPDWAANGIDRFVYARLLDAGLIPEPEADRYTLIRRVYLDLIGLPPGPTEVDRFVNDPSPDAYERVVDRLLDHPAYGERWAAVWLDLARYADSKGHGTDPARPMWPYRDWVISAFNADMPYDRFTIDQLAGDMSPGRTRDQLLATAMHRNTLSSDESPPSDDEEYRIAAVKDRVETTMQIWLGLTASCANCHDHKYDPITQTDYYRLVAIFNQTQDADRLDDLPIEPFADRITESLQAPIHRALDELDRELKGLESEIAAAQREWERTALAANPWTVVRPVEITSASGNPFTVLEDNSALVGGDAAFADTFTFVGETEVNNITGIRLDIMPHESLPLGGPGRNILGPTTTISELMLELLPASDGSEPQRVELAGAQASNVNAFFARGLIDGNLQSGWSTGRPFGRHDWIVCRTKDPLEGGPHRLRLSIVQNGGPGNEAGRFRVSVTSIPKPDLDSVIPYEVCEAIGAPQEERSERQRRIVRDYFVSIAPELKAWRARKAKLQSQLSAGADVPIMLELPPEEKRETRIHERGDFRSPGLSVSPGVPAVFGTPSFDGQVNRLAFARWLVDAESGVGGLAARVAVNRYWARFFGTGLVETEEDFGSQGAAPSHPKLLDWLTLRFVEDGMSFKRLCRRIVTSAAYRQSSRVSPDKLAADPRNRLISRGPRFRLDAEHVRDQAMTVSGLLSSKMLGPSVRPFMPEGVWDLNAFIAPWSKSPGADAYRRGVYTYIQRSVPYPSMQLFDAPRRETCSVSRGRSNTPLQAMVTLNDPVFVEAAQAMARRVMREGGSETRRRIDYTLRLAASRPATEEELDALASLYARRLAAFERDQSAAEQLAGEPPVPVPSNATTAELAAWTVVCNTVLNLDRVMTRP